jgi:hypothetical protein
MSWRKSSDAMRQALKEVAVPRLRERGFRGSFPHFSRISNGRVDLLTFQFSQYGPQLYIEIASCPAKESDRPSTLRTYHAGLYRRRVGPQPSLDFEGIATSEEARPFANAALGAIESQAEAWWAVPTPVVPPNTSLERTRER